MPHKGKRYAVIIGVSDYEPGERLLAIPFAANDAIRLRDTLCAFCDFDADRIKLLAVANGAESPTRANVLNSLKYVAQAAQAEDLILVFFAGHGVEVSSLPYLLTADTRMNVVLETAIDIRDLNKILEASQAKCIIRVFDACRSPFSAGRGLAGRMTDVLQESLFSAGTGWATLSSCSSGEISHETGEFQQGVFSYFLCEGLRGNAVNDDNIVTLERLVDYVKISLRNWSDSQTLSQTPHFQSDISGVTELARIPGATTEHPKVEAEHPFFALQASVHSQLASVASDARHLVFTDAAGFVDFASCAKNQVEVFVKSFADRSIVLTTYTPTNDNLQKASDEAWQQFRAAIQKSGVAGEFSNKTSVIEINLTGQEVVIPGSRLVIAAAQFSFFYWLWYQQRCQVPQLHNTFRPTPRQHSGFFTFTPSAAADPQKIEGAIREMLGRASNFTVDWTKQLCNFVDARLKPLRNIDSIIE